MGTGIEPGFREVEGKNNFLIIEVRFPTKELIEVKVDSRFAFQKFNATFGSKEAYITTFIQYDSGTFNTKLFKLHHLKRLQTYYCIYLVNRYHESLPYFAKFDSKSARSIWKGYKIS